MNIKAMQGYILAFGFMTYYKSENEVKGNLLAIDNQLKLIISKYKRNKINFDKYFRNGADYFENYCKENEVEISILAFVTQLIIKNPNKEKHKLLTELARNLNKEKMFSKEESIVKAKMLVNRFYNLIKE